MATQKVIQVKAPGKAELVPDAPLPKLRDDYIIVKTAAVALNPVDWKSVDYLAVPGAILGTDYSGVVEQVGSAVENGLKVGDRVFGMVHGDNNANLEDGAFAEHVTAKAALQIKFPESLSFTEAATLGSGIITVGQGLYQSLGLPLPDDPAKESFPILIYGGSTAVGSLAIQFAKLSGLEVVTTCSPRNNDLVRRAGADHVFDYNSPTVSEDIRKATNNRLAYVFDTVASQETANISSNAVGAQGGKYTSLSIIEQLNRDDITNLNTMAFTAVGEAFIIGGNSIPAIQKDFDFAIKMTRLAQELIAHGKLKGHPASVRSGGLGGVLEGLQDLREGKVSGTKIVYAL